MFNFELISTTTKIRKKKFRMMCVWLESADNGLVLTFYLRLIYVNVSECCLSSNSFYEWSKKQKQLMLKKERKKKICANVKREIKYFCNWWFACLNWNWRVKKKKIQIDNLKKKEFFFCSFSLINWVIIN
jgi:hypothetical protein